MRGVFDEPGESEKNFFVKVVQPEGILQANDEMYFSCVDLPQADWWPPVLRQSMKTFR